ncbi:MAG: hypothetical protein JWN70_4305 [Planctomycetaceae bacterium]|nr:hypothetical protein [Planctomycetaceae bacterium]
MHRHLLRVPAFVLLTCPASVVLCADRFIVTEHDTSGFVVEHHAGPGQFIVTDREPPLTKPVTIKRPVVLLYSASWCAPCRVARQELERSRLPFDIRVIDVTNGGQPEYVDSIPYFEWDSPRGRRFAKWSSVSDLVKRWELTR